jgi:hypothetical protein
VLTGDGTKVLYRRSPYTLPAVGGAVLGFVAAASLLYRRRRRGVRSNEYKDR